MSKNKFSDKFKEGVSVQEIEDFTRKHSSEVFSGLGLIIGAISSIFGFFTGPGLTIMFAALGAILGIFFPQPVERGLKQGYAYIFKQEKSTQLILGGVKILVAIFLPFVLFGIFGLLAGTSFHYYTRLAQTFTDHKPPRPSRKKSSEEHD